MKSIISILAAFFSAALLNAQTSGESTDKLAQGYVYIHTLRNEPSIERNGAELRLKRRDIVPANGLTIETVKGQCAMLVLSNRTVIFVKGNAKLTIENFEQATPFDFQLDDEYESTHSQLRISLDYGEIYMAMLSPRPTSRTIIKTTFGAVEPKTTAMYISCDKKNSKFAIFNGQAVFCGLDNKRDFVQQGQIGIVEELESKKMYPLKIEPMSSIQEDRHEKVLELCKLAMQSTEIKLSREGNFSARRLVPKDFFLRKHNMN